MTRDRLSKREDRALHQALASVVLTQFPNPQRKDCPETSVLRAIAKKSIPMHDPAHEHVGNCSPCFSELTEIRAALSRRRLMWSMGTASAAVVVLAFVAYFAFIRLESPIRQEAIQPVSPPPGSLATANSQTPEYQVAVLDLHTASTSRTVQPLTPESNRRPVEIPRGLLELTIHLPVGSEAGSYEVGIRLRTQPTTSISSGEARITEGTTKLTVKIDTRVYSPGEYDIAWRPTGFDWRYYPVFIR